MRITAIVIVATLVPLARGDVVNYDGSVFPEQAGFERFPTYEPDRWMSVMALAVPSAGNGSTTITICLCFKGSRSLLNGA